MNKHQQLIAAVQQARNRLTDVTKELAEFQEGEMGRRRAAEERQRAHHQRWLEQRTRKINALTEQIAVLCRKREELMAEQSPPLVPAHDPYEAKVLGMHKGVLLKTMPKLHKRKRKK